MARRLKLGRRRSAPARDVILDFGFWILDFGKMTDLASFIAGRYGTRDVFVIAERVGLKIVYQKWFPATAGEFHFKTKTIYVNENAGIPPEKIIAHELAHYFLKEFETPRRCRDAEEFNEEKFCDEFAEKLLKDTRYI